jgi:hypothetical protein
MNLNLDVVLAPVMGVLLFTGLWRGMSRMTVPVGTRVAIWLALAAAWTAWLMWIRSLALAGVFKFALYEPGGPRVIPTQLAVVVPPLVALVLCLVFSKSVGAFLDAFPASWLIGIQAFRVFGGSFIVGWFHGTVPAVFAWEAGSLDLVVGALAVPVAWALFRGTPRSRSLAVAWNWLGLIDFAIALVVSVLQRRAPELMGVGDPSRVGLGTYPLVLIPAFAVANSFILHGLSLWQLKRRRRRSPAVHSQLAAKEA